MYIVGHACTGQIVERGVGDHVPFIHLVPPPGHEERGGGEHQGRDTGSLPLGVLMLLGGRGGHNSSSCIEYKP